MCAAAPFALGGLGLASKLLGGKKKSSSNQSSGQPYEPTTQRYGAVAPATGGI
jgi:hypothetical protein